MKRPDLYPDKGKVLLIGDIDIAFSDVDTISETSREVEIYVNSFDAIDAAAKKNFAAIGIVMSDSQAGLISTIKALREVNSAAKIILLAQMHQEPTALHLVGPALNGKGAADDYLICPVETQDFYKSIMSLHGLRIVRPETPVTSIPEYGQRKELLEKLATTDELTGLKNRRYMWEFSRQIIERAKKGSSRVTLLVFDIDDFKHYNDVYGHSVGDEILRQAAVLVRRCCRRHDAVGRIGGDEFAVIFWDDPKRGLSDTEAERRSAAADHPREAIFIAKRFRNELEKAELHLLGPDGKGILTISGGLASFPRDGSTIQELFDQADKALLEAKRSGKNRIYLVGRPQNDIADIE